MRFLTTSKISENMHETPEGYLVCIGVSIARTGEMIYLKGEIKNDEGEEPIEPGPDGRIIIVNTADELFRPETIASFEGKDITVTHPQDFLDPSNVTRLGKGILSAVRRGEGEQENDLVADLLIKDRTTIEMVKAGLREVSCGYDAEYVQTGVGVGMRKNIIGNHLALVEEGRAGSSYAINDHKGKGSSMTLKEKIKAIFAKAQDEAFQAADASGEATPETKTGFVSYDEFKKTVDKFEAFMSGGKKDDKAADASTQPTENKPAEVVAKDAEGEESEEDKKKKQAARDAWIDAQMAKDAAPEEEGEETEDDMADGDEEEADETEDACDDDFEESTMSTGDAAARIEILAPGMKPGKGAKAKALLAAYATKDGKAVIDHFTGGKAPDTKDENVVNAIFIGASELLKETRTQELSRTKTRDADSARAALNPKGAMTAEQINEINSKHYAGRTN